MSSRRNSINVKDGPPGSASALTARPIIPLAHTLTPVHPLTTRKCRLVRGGPVSLPLTPNVPAPYVRECLRGSHTCDVRAPVYTSSAFVLSQCSRSRIATISDWAHHPADTARRRAPREETLRPMTCDGIATAVQLPLPVIHPSGPLPGRPRTCPRAD